MRAGEAPDVAEAMVAIIQRWEDGQTVADAMTESFRLLTPRELNVHGDPLLVQRIDGEYQMEPDLYRLRVRLVLAAGEPRARTLRRPDLSFMLGLSHVFSAEQVTRFSGSRQRWLEFVTQSWRDMAAAAGLSTAWPTERYMIPSLTGTGTYTTTSAQSPWVWGTGAQSGPKIDPVREGLAMSFWERVNRERLADRSTKLPDEAWAIEQIRAAWSRNGRPSSS